MPKKIGTDPTAPWEQVLHKKERNRASWTWADGEVLLDALVSVTEDGAALLLSKTSDGGALALQIWSGTARHKFYPVSSAELNELLTAMAGGQID